LYATTTLSGKQGFDLLNKAVDALIASVDVSPTPDLLWSAQYQQTPTSGMESLPAHAGDHIVCFPPPPMDLAFDDTIFDRVKDVWQKIVGNDAGEFLVYQDREVYDDDE
jgi:hypothetical protein